MNVTLGLPFVRTSPDHGTAFAFAGRGIADPKSMIAGDPAGRREGWREGDGHEAAKRSTLFPPLREVVESMASSPRKSLGQNFLFDLNLTSRIARSAGSLEGMTVVEVGPGPGGLTRAILAAGASRVIAIERDTRCLPALAEIAAHYPGRLEVIEADALAFDPRPLIGDAPARVIANLPYNVGTALLTGWLTSEAWPPWWRSLTLMFQREVAERIVADGASRRITAALACWRAGEPMRPSCSTCRRRPSCRRQ